MPYENPNAKTLEQEKHFTLKEPTSRRGQLQTEGCPCGSSLSVRWHVPFQQRYSPERTPCHPFQMKPDLGAASTASVLGCTSRQPHASSSSFTCANTAYAVIPFPAQTPQEIPTKNVLPLPSCTHLLSYRRHNHTPSHGVSREAFPPFQHGFHREGGASGTGETGRASSFRFPTGVGRPKPPLSPGGPASPQFPEHPWPHGAQGRGKYPSRLPEAAAPQPRGCHDPRPYLHRSSSTLLGISARLVSIEKHGSSRRGGGQSAEKRRARGRAPTGGRWRSGGSRGQSARTAGRAATNGAGCEVGPSRSGDRGWPMDGVGPPRGR